MTIVTVAEVENNFEKYLQIVQEGGEVIVLKNGKKVARLVSYDKNTSFLTESLTGIIKEDYDDKEVKAERMEDLFHS